VRKGLLEQRWPWLAAAAVVVLAFLSTIVEVGHPGDRDLRPLGSADQIARLRERSDLNVLFILIDTLRADRLGSYGYARDTSPTLDRLAASGVRFARHLAQSSWTKCSMASLWSALYPAHIGVTRFDHVMPGEARLAAEILKPAGFRTVGLYRNGWVAPTFGFDQGFDVYTRPAPRPLPPAVRAANPTLQTRGTDEDTIAAGLEFLRAYGGERWFLYLHLMDVHEYLYDADSALFGGSYSDIYDNSIHWVDGTIDILLAHLQEQGQAGKTLVVIASDHGEAFLERGFEGHAREVYRETTEVPFLLSFPFRLEPGVVVHARSRNVDVWPTVLDLLGLEPPPGLDGRSLVPEILASARGDAPAGADGTAVAHLDRNWGQRQREPAPSVAVAEGSLRYVRGKTDRGRDFEQLFDAARDPRELEDRAAQDPETLARLRALADAYLDAQSPWGEVPTREIDELELNQLRALGYAVP
jgi:arylsulfatase A-like enzyme